MLLIKENNSGNACRICGIWKSFKKSQSDYYYIQNTI